MYDPVRNTLQIHDFTGILIRGYDPNQTSQPLGRYIADMLEFNKVRLLVVLLYHLKPKISLLNVLG